MTPTAPPEPRRSLAELVERVQEGWTLVSYDDRPYGLSRTTRASGGSISLLARELGGPDLVSANVYTTSKGPQLRACEIPDRKVLDFLVGWQPQREGAAPPPVAPDVDEDASSTAAS